MKEFTFTPYPYTGVITWPKRLTEPRLGGGTREVVRVTEIDRQSFTSDDDAQAWMKFQQSAPCNDHRMVEIRTSTVRDIAKAWLLEYSIHLAKHLSEVMAGSPCFLLPEQEVIESLQEAVSDGIGPLYEAELSPQQMGWVGANGLP